MTLLGWWENLPTKDQPPEELYGDDKALADHFTAVRARNDPNGGDQDEVVPMTRNEAVRR